jgi:hypothetical protein
MKTQGNSPLCMRLSPTARKTAVENVGRFCPGARFILEIRTGFYPARFTSCFRNLSRTTFWQFDFWLESCTLVSFLEVEMKRFKPIFVGVLLLGLATHGYSQQPPNPTQVQVQRSAGNPLYKITVNVVERT